MVSQLTQAALAGWMPRKGKALTKIRRTMAFMELKIIIEDFIKFCDEPTTLEEETLPDLSYGDYDKAYIAIRAQLGNDVDLLASQLLLIRKKLAIWNIKTKTDPTFYLRVFNCLFEAARFSTEQEVLAGEADWKRAIDTVLHYKDVFGAFARSAKERFDNKTYEFALAYVKLEKHGILFHELNNEIHIRDESYELINSDIHKYCKNIGGKKLLQTLFELLSPEYKSAAGRFLSLRRVTINHESRIAEVPYGYLLAIGARHIGDKGTKNSENHFVDLISFCRDLTTIFEIQPYSQWETLFLPTNKFIKFLQETVWHDNLISFSQVKAQHAKLMLTRLSKSFIDNKLQSADLLLRDIHRVANALIDLSKDKLAIGVTPAAIAAQAKVQLHTVRKIMDSVLAYCPSNVNTTLTFPPVSNDIDYYFKPAIMLKDKYYLYPKSICALGALNSVLRTISFPSNQQNKTNEAALGYEVEDLLREQFESKGFNISYGDRRNISGEKDFECDLLIETSKAVLIFEIKKKGLTRKAMSGEEISLLKDLADSLMFSHMQAMRIERHLKDNHSIELIHKGESKTISLSGRKTKRISVSLNDFGALQDKVGLQIILRHATDTTLNHPEKKDDEKLGDWRTFTSEIRRLAELNNEYDVGSGLPFHDSFFMSIPQILTVLSDSSSCDEFESRISLMSAMTHGTRDFYREYYYGKEMKDRATKILAGTNAAL
jgi:hypothetical protein